MSGDAFGGAYAGRRVLVTGHTGFLGGWAVRWLGALGAEVAGYSRGRRTSTGGVTKEFTADIADAGAVAAAMAAFGPEIVLHLAGSTVVAAGFRAPAATFRDNVSGTAAVLDAATRQESVRSVVVAGTPAVTDLGDDLRLGPYPASKLAVEACVAAFAHERTQRAAGRAEPLRIGVARPGVMIGGDWGEGRVLADVVMAISKERPVTLAAPDAVRPWQHVLDGLSGILTLAAWPAPRRRYDFGCDRPGSVRDLVSGFLAAYGVPEWPVSAAQNSAAQNGAARNGAADRVELGYAAALADLGWRPVWDLPRALAASAAWYQADQRDLAGTMDDQITAYVTEGVKQCVFS